MNRRKPRTRAAVLVPFTVRAGMRPWTAINTMPVTINGTPTSPYVVKAANATEAPTPSTRARTPSSTHRVRILSGLVANQPWRTLST